MANKEDERLKRDNVQRMCLKHGAFLGSTRNTRTQWWVCDCEVWQVDADRASI